eukprot:10184401-Alexandrium_andersonii.AAC.1
MLDPPVQPCDQPGEGVRACSAHPCSSSVLPDARGIAPPCSQAHHHADRPSSWTDGDATGT